MTTYYVDPVGGNNANAGTSTGAAWATTQKALTECNGGVIAAGDTVLLMATAVETVTAEIATAIAKRVLFCGANALGVVDGTRYQITTASAITSLLNFQHGGPYIFAFVDFNANSNATHAVDCDNVNVITMWCKFRGGVQNGWFQGISGGQATARHFAGEFYSNGSNGCYPRGGILVECSAYSNGARGFYGNTTCFMIRCRAYRNATVGFGDLNADGYMWGCTSEDNTTDGAVSIFNTHVGVVANSIFTRNAWGINKSGTTPVGSYLIQNFFGASAFANASGDTNLTVSTELLKMTGDPNYVDPDGTPVDLHYDSSTPTEDAFAPWESYFGAGHKVGWAGGGGPTDFPVVAATAITDYSADQTSHVINLPASIAAGDLLLLWFTMDNQSGVAITTPSGWTLEEATICAVNQEFGYLFSKVASGSEGSTVTVTSTGVSQSSAAIAVRITDWDALYTEPGDQRASAMGITLPPLTPIEPASGVALTFVCVTGSRDTSDFTNGATLVKTTSSGSLTNTVATLLYADRTVSADLEVIQSFAMRQNSASTFCGVVVFVAGPPSAGGGSGDYTFNQVKQIRYRARQGVLI